MNDKPQSPLLLAAHEILSACPNVKIKLATAGSGEVLQALWYSDRKDGMAAGFARSEGGWYFSSDEDGGMVNIQLHADGRIEISSPDGELRYVSGRIQSGEEFSALLKILRALKESDVAGMELDRQPLARLLE